MRRAAPAAIAVLALTSCSQSGAKDYSLRKEAVKDCTGSGRPNLETAMQFVHAAMARDEQTMTAMRDPQDFEGDSNKRIIERVTAHGALKNVEFRFCFVNDWENSATQKGDAGGTLMFSDGSDSRFSVHQHLRDGKWLVYFWEFNY
jgi:hypothetical protein